VELTSKLESFEDYIVAYKWACDQGEGFHFVEDINVVSRTFTATEETLLWSWQLAATFRDTKQSA
jgi:hypothetical protein